ncbi:hypothetical protein DFH07DRAFT_778046 [Mycena maculata]|uniref:Uncharacterized protein n=1 Tax=Mycena maculata TaxID=230809 RepID=A0AAD7N1I9_9AGAR|nr:hypothetical protein DFH07DRAFT_778046 [Mycena maculata]
MGRKQHTILRAEAEVVYQCSLLAQHQLHPPPTLEPDDLWASTTDPMVAFWRRQYNPDIPRAVESLPTVPIASLRSPPITPPQSPIIFASLAPPLEPEILRNAPALSELSGFNPTFQGMLTGPVPEVPVMCADTLISVSDIITQYAILGPNQVSLIQRGCIMQLTHERLEVVMVTKNHGYSIEKPGCTIVEACFVAGSVVESRSPCVLLAARYLMDPMLEKKVPLHKQNYKLVNNESEEEDEIFDADDLETMG